MMPLTCHAYSRLFASVEALGGEVPPSVAAVLGSVDVLFLKRKANQQSPEEALMGAIREAADAEQALSPEEARALCIDLAAQRLVLPLLMEHYQSVDFQAATLIYQMLQGDAGDELMASLQPTTDRAIEGVQRASEFFNADTTLAQVVELGPDAVEAWQEAKQHQAVLDRIYTEVLGPLTWGELAFVPPDLTDLPVHGMRMAGIWVLDPNRAQMLDEVGSVMAALPDRYPVPGGRWLKANSLCGLRLNSPRQAIRILRSIQEARMAEAASRMARPAPGGPKIRVRQ